MTNDTKVNPKHLFYIIPLVILIGIVIGNAKTEASIKADHGTVAAVSVADPVPEPDPVPKTYNTSPVSVYKATMPTEKSSFVMVGKLSDYYNYEFSEGKAAYYSIRLCDADEFKYGMCAGEGELNGYIKKTDAKALFSVLKDGKSHLMNVVIVYPSSKEDSGIVRLLSSSLL
jgi:hypothetical protein